MISIPEPTIRAAIDQIHAGLSAEFDRLLATIRTGSETHDHTQDSETAACTTSTLLRAGIDVLTLADFLGIAITRLNKAPKTCDATSPGVPDPCITPTGHPGRHTTATGWTWGDSEPTPATSTRRFTLDRGTDHTGVSGTGTVADGILWPNGTVTLRWRGEHSSLVHWKSLSDLNAIHGHNGATRVTWIDPM